VVRLYVRYKILIDVVAGMVIGYVIAPTVFGWVSTTELARVMEGAEALGGTLLAYAVTELRPRCRRTTPVPAPFGRGFRGPRV
jgi:NhaP-type Na+/H+ and K+/H+ antiporter